MKNGLLTGFILLLSALTYGSRLGTPAAFYWDENYHIPSAQKYLHGTFFMEPHPPLGKLLMAAGEKILNLNPPADQFIGTGYAKRIPGDFSLAGYRALPTLFSAATAGLVFWIFLLLIKNPVNSTLLSLLYVFDNALIVHNRGAMLDGIMLFFGCSVLLLFLLLREKDQTSAQLISRGLLFGICFGLLMTTKVLGLITILLIPALAPAFKSRHRQFLRLVSWMLIGFTVTYIGVWQTHFSLAGTVNPSLPNNGYFQASKTYREYLANGQHRSLLAFPVMLRDSLGFTSHYNKGVPTLNFKKDKENGSPFFLWPTGGRTISYRWNTAGNQAARYMYLVPNPVSWLTSLIGVLVALGLVVVNFCVGLKKPLQQPYLLTVLLGLYLCYMIAIAQINRVMYLYHYFIPLLLGFFLFGLVINEIKQFGKWKFTESRRTYTLVGLAIALVVAFQAYRPLTYNLPITNQTLSKLNLLPWWDMRCAKCERSGYFAKPL